MNRKQIFLTIVIALAVSLSVHFGFMPSSKTAAEKESVYARVMRTGTIRCGYGLQPPFLMKDPNTGAITGIYKDYMDALGKALLLKVEWVEEAGWGNMPTDLAAGRYDAFCTEVWESAARARVVYHTKPIAYSAVWLYARGDDKRFDNNLAAADHADVTITTLDGAIENKVVAAKFPQAKKLDIPQDQSTTLEFENVATGKADLTAEDATTAAAYMEHNPDKIRQIEGVPPLALFGDVMAIKHGEDAFLNLINTATVDLIQNGTMEQILKKYKADPRVLLRVAAPYQQP